MVDTNYPESLRFLLRWEGGYVNLPSDHGGPTNKGVTQLVYDAWRARNGQPSRDVRDITAGEVHEIYRDDYWTPSYCDRIQRRLDLVQFDTSVNMGTHRAILIVQEATGSATDGHFGQATEQACANCDLGTTLDKYCKIREGLYRRFAREPGQERFLKGWLNRLNDLRRTVGLRGLERGEAEPDFGDSGFVARIPDLPEGASLEDWR